MIKPTGFRKGQKIVLDGELYEVVDFQRVAMGRGRGFVRTRIKNLISGNTMEKSFDSTMNIEEASLDKREMQYLYEQNKLLNFMDTGTFEQKAINAEALGNSRWYLIEGESYEVIFWGDRAISISLPASVVLTVTQTEPGVKGDSVTNITKDAILQTGLKVKVPLFVNIGDKIKIDTRTGEYIGRV